MPRFPGIEEGPHKEPFFDNLSNGVWSPRKKIPLTGLERWSGFIIRSVLSWSFFLFLGVLFSFFWRAFFLDDELMLVLLFTMVFIFGGTMMVHMVIKEKKFQKEFSRDFGIWYFSTVRSEPLEVNGLLESAESHLEKLGLRIVTMDRGTPNKRTRFMRIEETPMMVLLSYDLTAEEFRMEVEVGPQRRSFKREMFTLMGHIRDWSEKEISSRVGDLDPDPRDPGMMKVRPQSSA